MSSVLQTDDRFRGTAPPKERPLENIGRDATATKYLRNMERQGELLPGAADVILKRLDGPVARATVTGNLPLDRLVRAATFLEGPQGKVFLNPEHTANPTEPPFKAALRRLGLADRAVSEVYNAHAVELAGRSGSMLLSSVWRILDAKGYHAALGYEPIPESPAPVPVREGAARSNVLTS